MLVVSTESRSSEKGMMFLTVRNGSSLARKQIESGLAMIIKQRGKPGQVWAKNSY